MKQRNKRTGGKGFAGDKIKYIRMAAIPVVIVVVLMIIIVVMDKNPSEDGDKALSQESSAQVDSGIGTEAEDTDSQGEVAPDNNQYTMDFSQYELKKDEIPQVNLLMSEYFQAKVDKDAEKLYQLFGKEADGELEKRRQDLENEAVYIEDYQDIVCYTKPGLTEGAYVAYVTYEVKFRRVDTLAPGLMWCYVTMLEDGSYIIRENVVGDEADYVAKQNQSEDVLLLSKQVNERLRAAIESDSLLAGIYKELRNGAVVNSSEEETGEGQDSTVILEGQESQSENGDGTENSGDTGASGEESAAQAAAINSGAVESGSAPAEDGNEAASTQGGNGADSGDSAAQQTPGEGGSQAVPETTGGSSVKIE